MADLYVGGMNLFSKNRYKTLKEACEHAREGDIIHLEKNDTLDGAVIQAGFTITGGKVITIPTEKVGIINDRYNLTLKDVTVLNEAKSNLVKISKENNQRLTFDNVKFEFQKNSDPRDWFPIIHSLSTHIHVDIQQCTIPYLSLNAQSVKITRSNIGHFFGPLSKIQTHRIESDKTELTHLLLKGFNGESSASLKHTITKGKLNVRQFKGMIDGISFRLELFKDKDFKRKFLDSSYEHSKLSGITFLQCEPMTLKDLRVRVKPHSESNLLWNTLNIQNSDLMLVESTLPLSPLKNLLKGSEMKVQNVTDQSQWQEENSKLSKASIEKEGEGAAFKEIMSMVGLNTVKTFLDQMMSTAITNQALQKAGLPANDAMSLHMVFAGNPGSGKTTIAKLFGEALFQEGILPTSKFTVATRKDLVGQYQGHTAEKTHQLIQQARGGVLLIDEAYSLRPSKDGRLDFASEAVDQLVMDAEEYRSEMVIILAGYTKEMQDFIDNANPGLKSRFTNWIEFPDYNLQELLQILTFTLEKRKAIVEDPYRLEQSFAYIYNLKGYVEGNGRFVRNYVERLIRERDTRNAISIRQKIQLTPQQLLTITADDILDTQAQYD